MNNIRYHLRAKSDDGIPLVDTVIDDRDEAIAAFEKMKADPPESAATVYIVNTKGRVEKYAKVYPE